MKYLLFLILLCGCAQEELLEMCPEKTLVFDNTEPADVLIYSLQDCCPRELICTVPGYGIEEVTFSGEKIKIHAIYIGCCEWVEEFDLTDCENVIIL